MREESTRETRMPIMALPRAAASRGLFPLILLPCCGLMLAAAAASDSGVDDDGVGVGGDKLMMDRFLSWQATYNRSYPTAEERQRRFQVYRRNIEHIEATNRAGNLTYTLGENQFADLTEEEFLDQYSMKGMPVRRDAGETLANVSFSGAVDAPVSVDWRSRGAVTPIKNQGTCASCWAFTTAATIEGITQIRRGHLVSLSEQELVDCDMSNGGCNMGYFVKAYRWVINNGGLTTEASYPYQGRRNQCNRSKAKAARISRCVQVPSGESNLMQAVAQQPVAGAVMMGGGLQFYKGGVFSGQCGNSMNHAITIVGYGADGQKYWLIKNSWGTSWGERGYLRIRRDLGNGGGRCGIASDLAYPVV